MSQSVILSAVRTPTGKFLGALGLRLLVRASSRGFVLNRSLQDPAFYEEMVRRRILILPG